MENSMNFARVWWLVGLSGFLFSVEGEWRGFNELLNYQFSSKTKGHNKDIGDDNASYQRLSKRSIPYDES